MVTVIPRENIWKDVGTKLAEGLMRKWEMGKSQEMAEGLTRLQSQLGLESSQAIEELKGRLQREATREKAKVGFAQEEERGAREFEQAIKLEEMRGATMRDVARIGAGAREKFMERISAKCLGTEMLTPAEAQYCQNMVNVIVDPSRIISKEAEGEKEERVQYDLRALQDEVQRLKEKGIGDTGALETLVGAGIPTDVATRAVEMPGILTRMHRGRMRPDIVTYGDIPEKIGQAFGRSPYWGGRRVGSIYQQLKKLLKKVI